MPIAASIWKTMVLKDDQNLLTQLLQENCNNLLEYYCGNTKTVQQLHNTKVKDE